MRLEEIETPVAALAGVGPTASSALAALEVFTVGDLLAHYPRDWDDRTERVLIASYDEAARQGKRVHTIAQVTGHRWFGGPPPGTGFASGGRRATLKIRVTDGYVEADLVAFNRPFLEKSLPVGAVIGLTGDFSWRYGGIQSTAFDTLLITRSGRLSDYTPGAVPGSEVFPVYPLTAGLSQVQLRKWIRQALARYGRGIEGDVPPALLDKRKLLPKQDALRAVHQSASLAEAHRGRESLIYEELFRFQEAIVRRTLERRGIRTGPDRVDDLSPRQQKLLEALPFALTVDQQRVIAELNADIDRTSAMARLLQGDVGSGKTLAAFFAILRVIDSGGQAALLAPTEILARQHGETAARFLDTAGVRLAYLTGNVKSRARGTLLKALAAGDVDLAIGTHALFSRQVRYKNLRLAVIDEQHRFGVLQRNAIIEKGRDSAGERPPHFLMMSATPIPRTLALTVFGDLEVSTIATLPSGRLPIKTYLARMGNEQKVYDFVRRELSAGHQAYFVYPRIEEGEGDEAGSPDAPLKSAEEMFRKIGAEIYPGIPAALVHSKVDEEDQHRALTDFREGRIKILVATSVVEVGVDNPNATCMVIEHADRFGLAALHQLRGRVGRGSLQSHCFLVYSTALKDDGIARMKALRSTTDGFVIAEEDLRLRGPGEVAGIQQSGYLTLGIADPIRDAAVMALAREDVLEIMQNT
ncbi:MAG: ATP-dependent DNA helicase RecG [Spirochaetaceae bacterium]|jgi:ATP-dependent DNA helicase RecG|nr:ATP-dependent DNA helicase RecG [Spirochaetaceae bacterium]